MISGTPVIDIKPYIPQYDSPWNHEALLSGSQDVIVKHASEFSPAVIDEISPALNFTDTELNNCGCCDNSEPEILSPAVVSDGCQNSVEPTVSVAKWITTFRQSTLSVRFTERAEQQLKQFDSKSPDANFQLLHLHSAHELRTALIALLEADPRSVYRRQHCRDMLYYVTVDVAHVTCWFDDDSVEVLKIQSLLLLQKDNGEKV